LQVTKDHPGGCLLVQGAVSAGDKTSRIRKEVLVRLSMTEDAIRKRLKRAKSEGDLPRHANPASLARFIMAILEGISVAGATGASRKQLQTIAEVALRAWPS
jgi:hypothetical protein